MVSGAGFRSDRCWQSGAGAHVGGRLYLSGGAAADFNCLADPGNPCDRVARPAIPYGISGCWPSRRLDRHWRGHVAFALAELARDMAPVGCAIAADHCAAILAGTATHRRAMIRFTLAAGLACLLVLPAAAQDVESVTVSANAVPGIWKITHPHSLTKAGVFGEWKWGQPRESFCRIEQAGTEMAFHCLWMGNGTVTISGNHIHLAW